MDCRVCSDGYNYYVASFQTNEAKSPGNISTKQTPECKECPYGAICSGNNVVPRPNYWGYWMEDELKFVLCPAGYCCSGTDSAPCERYDSCAGFRTGVLCGACKKGFTVSIMTGECMADSNCGQDQWFWFLAFLATASYAFWYTFKDDLMSLFFLAVDALKYRFGTFLRCRICHMALLRQNSNVATMRIVDLGKGKPPSAVTTKDVKKSQ